MDENKSTGDKKKDTKPHPLEFGWTHNPEESDKNDLNLQAIMRGFRLNWMSLRNGQSGQQWYISLY